MRPLQITTFSVVLMGLCFWMAPKIPFLTDATEYFPKDSRLRESIRSVEKHLMGNPTFEILLSPKGESGSKKQFDYEDLQRIDATEKELAAAFSDDYKILSRNTIISEGNYLYSGQQAIPKDIYAYEFIEEQATNTLMASFPRKNIYRLSMMGSTLNRDLFEEHKAKIASHLKQLKDMNWEFNGLHYNMLEAQNALISILVKSFLLSLALISLLAFAYFRRLSVLIVFLVVNVLPVMGALVFMSLAGLSINIATVMTFSISLGMIVDSTIHLTYDFEKKVPWPELYRSTLIPVIASALLLTLSFSLFGFSDFLPIRQIGIVLSFTVFLGLIMDLFVLPTLLLRSNRYDEAMP